MRSSDFLVCSFVVLLMQLGVAKTELVDPSTVYNSIKMSDGFNYVKDAKGGYWKIMPSDAEPDYSFFFYHTSSELTQWTDPRFPADHDQVTFETHEGKIVEKKTVYVFDSEGKVVKTEVVLDDEQVDTGKVLHKGDTKIESKSKKGDKTGARDLNLNLRFEFVSLRPVCD
eukprot:gene28668-31845_t